VNNLEFHKKIIEFAETNIADQEEIKQYKKETKVKEIRFETNEFSGVSNSSHVFAAKERVCIKCYYELGYYNQYYQPPIVITLTSTVSNRYKYVTVIGNRGETNPYAIFQPNEIEETPPIPPPVPDPPPGPPAITVAVKVDGDTAPILNINLIKTTRNAQKESISVLSGFKDDDSGNAVEDGLTLYNKKDFFAYQLTRATLKGADLPNNVVDVSKIFCLQGGEVIYANYQELKGYTIVANQADWFMIEAHGDFIDGRLEFMNSYNKKYQVTPKELEGKYDEDMDVLILNACYCLKWTSKRTEISGVKRWQKVLPNGLIIGYGMSIKPYTTKEIFKTFSEKIIKNMEPKEITDLWLKIHADVLNEPGYTNYDPTNHVEGAACIINEKCGRNELIRQVITNDEGSETVLSKYEPKYYDIK
ncbi:MAG TPA: hypothetical protein DC017_02425, partial [Candidatus Wallbacteria bacterium]|nr:hypothetical protein [Candidatus Wallbacteria bacterium]